MIEFIVIVERSADAQTATKLAERVLLEEVDWLEADSLQYYFQWSGLQEDTDHSYWTDIIRIIDNLQQSSGFRLPRYRDQSRGEPRKSDGASAMKVLNLARFLQKTRQIKAVLFIRDLDHQPERRQSIEQARLEHINRQPKLEIVIGTADRTREAWVLNGFIPSNKEEERILDGIVTQLNFDPCKESHRLRSNSFEEPDRIRNPKVVVKKLTKGDRSREQQCWEETPLNTLEERGLDTGLRAYIHEIRQRLAPIISE